MYTFQKEFWKTLAFVEPVQFFIGFFFDFNDVDRWSRWTDVEFHLSRCSGCLGDVLLLGHIGESKTKSNNNGK